MIPMIDAIGSNPRLSDIAKGKPPRVAGYDTGTGIMWTIDEWGKFPDSEHLHIDQRPGLASLAAGKSHCGDVEGGAGTVQDYIAAARHRKDTWNIPSMIYLSASKVNDAHAAIILAGLGGRYTLWWVADWSLSEEQATRRLGGSVVAVQYASPTSNPGTLLPGTGMTLKEANADLSVTLDTWHPRALDVPVVTKPPVTTSGWIVYDGLAKKVRSTDLRNWTVV